MCGVAVKDANDVIEMDMCDGKFTETSVQVSVKSKHRLAKGLRITESDSGKRYTVSPSIPKEKEELAS